MPKYNTCAHARPGLHPFTPIDLKDHDPVFPVAPCCKRAVSYKVAEPRSYLSAIPDRDRCESCPMFTDPGKLITVRSGDFRADIYLDRLLDLPVTNLRKLIKLILSDTWTNEAAIERLSPAINAITGRNLCAQSVKRLSTGENQTATVPPLSGRPKRPRSLPRWGKWLCKWQRLCGLNNGCTGPKGRVFGCDLFILCYLPEHEQHQQRHLPEHQWQCQQQQLHQHQRVPPRSDGKARPSRPKAKSSAIHHIKGGHIQP